MDICFDDKKLLKYALDPIQSQKRLGAEQAKLFKRRLDELSVAETLEDVRDLGGHYHELTANRKGYWAVSLNKQYRLIFKPQEEPIPLDANGKYLWNKIKGICIVAIEDYHKKGEQNEY